MKHQNGRRKLNRKPAHRKALLRNQIIHFIRYGFLQTTKPRIKEVQRLVEKLITVSKLGYNFNTIRRVKQALPYDSEMVTKLIQEIAPKYIDRNGGYTRVLKIGRRAGDSAEMAIIELVDYNLEQGDQKTKEKQSAKSESKVTTRKKPKKAVKKVEKEPGKA